MSISSEQRKIYQEKACRELGFDHVNVVDSKDSSGYQFKRSIVDSSNNSTTFAVVYFNVLNNEFEVLKTLTKSEILNSHAGREKYRKINKKFNSFCGFCDPSVQYIGYMNN